MSKNQALFDRAQQTIPGGVNSPVRAFRSVGGTPRFIERAQGPYFWDADGQRYIDYIGSWGPMILGHVHPEVLDAVQRVLANGFSFGAPTEAEIEIAEEICKLVPSIEQVRMVSSGTEATMSALRLARGFTNRSRIVKFEGCYHGHADSLLVKAGSGLLTFGNPTSAGVPADIAKHTTVLEYNNVEQLNEAFEAFGNEIASVIVEPVAGNMNLVRATPEFLAGLARSLQRVRRGADLRRSHVRFSRRARRRAGALRHEAGPDLPRQGDRRRHAGGRVRRTPRHHGASRAARRRLPGGHAVGQSDRGRGGLEDAATDPEAGLPRQLATQTKRLTHGLTAAAREAKVPFVADALGGMFGLYFAEAIPTSFARSRRATRSASTRSSTRCSTRACTSRRRRTKRASSRSLTTTP